MSISADYPHPVNVNGYSCKNCTDVDYAKKHIDPAHPRSGPYGVTAAADPSNQDFIRLDGALKPHQQVQSAGTIDPQAAGFRLNIQA